MPPKSLISCLLVCGFIMHGAVGPAIAATADEIKKQQDQIRERSKDIEDRALAEKQARERDEARKALELREKQWREEYPNAPFPRNGLPDPGRQPPRPPLASQPGPVTGDPANRSLQATLNQIDYELKSLNQRLMRLEQLLNAQAGHGNAALPPPPPQPPASNNPPHPTNLKDAISEQQAEIRNRSRAIEDRARYDADMRERMETRNTQFGGNGYITPKVISDYYLGPKEPPLRR